MKGKGKGNRVDVDCPLHFPDLKSLDHTRYCPVFNSVLDGAETDSVLEMDEVDSLQAELESLLTTCSKRLRQIENELQLLNNWMERKDKKGGHTAVFPGRGKSDERPKKKFKDMTGKGVTSSPGPGRPKSKIVEVPAEPVPEVPRIPKNEAPSRFWASIEPYCSEITTDDLKVLEEVIQSHEDDADYYKIPSLGKHYAQKWANEDMLEEQKEGNKVTDKRRGGGTSSSPLSTSRTEGSKMLQRADNDMSEDASPFGPLTQRLVSALIEENIMTPIDDSPIAENRDSEVIANMTTRQLAKELNIRNTAQLERRIKRELEEQGILEVEEHPEDNPDDEVLAELRQKQQELKAIGQHNLAVTKRLYKMAKDEIAKQDLRRKMTAVDAEIMDCYRKVQATRLKKKTPTKKEKDMLYKALKEREGLLKQTENH